MSELYKSEFHPVSEQLVEVLMTQAQNAEAQFFRMQVAYFISTIASQMHIHVKGWANDLIPVNMYVCNLSPSGSGKGLSTGRLTGMLKAFYTNLYENTFPITSDRVLQAEASKRSAINGTTEENERAALDKEFFALGQIPIAFDSVGSSAAIKQLRTKIQLTGLGSLNLQIDEIGANLVNQTEALTTFIELYDKGIVLEKLIKSNKENLRTQKVDRNTPANMLLFGVPQKLFDGGKTEQEFFSMLSMGYARRCFFGFAERTAQMTNKSVDELLDDMFSSANDQLMTNLSDRISTLSNINWANGFIHIEREQAKKLLTYKQDCLQQSLELAEHQDIEISELQHRYFKVLKLAAAYAFFDFQNTITDDHLNYAITLAEESGKALAKIVNPERPYVRLAKYLLASKRENTLSDLEEVLPFMRGSQHAKNELIYMAISWGIKNNILISKSYMDNILFLSASSIPQTSLDSLYLSYSNQDTHGYVNDKINFTNLVKLMTMPTVQPGVTPTNLHWVNHHLKNQHRLDSNAFGSFNLLVFDVDGTSTVEFVSQIFKDYQFIIATTKRHTDEQQRFRLIFFTNYLLTLNTEDYKTFMNSIMDSLPIVVDDASNQRVKKWLTNPLGKVYTNNGKLFDVLPFIPKTSQNEKHQATLLEQSNLDNLERWVLNNTGDGNRNKQLYRYAMILKDAGKGINDIQNAVRVLNSKLKDKLSDDELFNTIFFSLARSMPN